MSELSKAKQMSDFMNYSTMDTPTPKMNIFNKSATSGMFSSPRDSNTEAYKFMQSGLSVIGS
jgi:hypothetical protein